jgi:hypothetical protein
MGPEPASCARAADDMRVSFANLGLDSRISQSFAAIKLNKE